MHIVLFFVIALAFIGPVLGAEILRRLAIFLAGIIVVVGLFVAGNTSFNGANMLMGFLLAAGVVWGVLTGIAWVLDGAPRV